MESEICKKIEDSIKEAMKAHDAVKRDCLRSVLAVVKDMTVNAGKDITDDACVKALQKAVKMHNDSIAQFTDAGREDLAAKEKAELDVLVSFLPKMLDKEDIKAIVESIVASISSELGRSLEKKDMGTVMKKLKMHKDAKLIDMKDASMRVAILLK